MYYIFFFVWRCLSISRMGLFPWISSEWKNSQPGNPLRTEMDVFIHNYTNMVVAFQVSLFELYSKRKVDVANLLRWLSGHVFSMRALLLPANPRLVKEDNQLFSVVPGRAAYAFHTISTGQIPPSPSSFSFSPFATVETRSPKRNGSACTAPKKFAPI